SKASADVTITRVANLKTSRPFIFTSRSGWSKLREPLPGSHRCSPPPPSAPSSKPRKPPSSPRSSTTAPARPRCPAPPAVGAEPEAEEAAVLDALEHDRSGPVAEEDERRAVGPVEDLRQDVAADDERLLREAGRDHRMRLRQRVDEARATREEVVRGRVGCRQ